MNCEIQQKKASLENHSNCVALKIQFMNQPKKIETVSLIQR